MEDRTPRKIVTTFLSFGGTGIKTTERLETKEEVNARIKDAKEREAKEAYRRRNAVDLYCDVCHSTMGMVYDFDLNGSCFYHKECLKQ